MSEGTLLAVRDLQVAFVDQAGHPVHAVRGVSLDVGRGETVGVVGESGSGKSVTLRAIVGLIKPPGVVLGGSIVWDGRELPANATARAQLRGTGVAMIFQDPGMALDPVLTVGVQLTEVLRKKRGMRRREAERRALELLKRVEIPSAERRMRSYAHELSGGMRQRVMIALALSCDPVLLLADEPTTALDVTIQDQVLSLLADLQRESGMAIVLVSHDMGVIAQASDRIGVMKDGELVEIAVADDLLEAPTHPYTQTLLNAVPVPPPAPAARIHVANPGASA